MKPHEIDALIKKMEAEMRAENADHTQLESLKRLKEVAKRYQGDDEVVSEEVVRLRAESRQDELKILTGWTDLDKILKGFRLKQLVVVSALTKSGKTSWLMNLTQKVAEHSPMWLPFEESAEELILKYIDRQKPVPKFFTPLVMKGNTIEWVERKIVESIAKYNTRIVVIDHLDFIVPFGADNHALRVAQAMRELKGLAKKWDIVLFIICHLSKARMDTEPTIEDLRGSSAIAQEADTVILLWREMVRERGHVVITNNTTVSVQANRRTGSTGNVKMVFNEGEFIEQDWKGRNEEMSDDDDY